MNNQSFRNLLSDVGRTSKPRPHGISIVLDIGLGLHGIDDLVATAGEYLDYAKIAWGSSLITCNITDKIERYLQHGVKPLLGGTLFEYLHMRGRTEELLALAKDYKLHVEISDGTALVDAKEKLKWVERFAAVTDVFSEVGGKTEHHQLDWKSTIENQLNAGASMVVVEGREVGPVGQEIREDFVDELVGYAGPEKLVFESLERKQQIFFIKKIGPNVNLANIRPEHLLTLESFRCGLKEHTLLWTYEKNK